MTTSQTGHIIDQHVSRRARLMTVGELSRRTGVSIKALRAYTDMGLIYTVGRSAANYRLFDDEALWCVHTIGMLRGLGLTIAEIRDLAAAYNGEDNCPFGPRLADLLRASRARVDARIAGLEQMRRRIDDFVTAHQAELAGHTPDVCWTDDPRMRARSA